MAIPTVEVIRGNMAPIVCKHNSLGARVGPAEAVEAIVGSRGKIVDMRYWPWGDQRPSKKNYVITVKVKGGLYETYFVGHRNAHYWFVSRDYHSQPHFLPFLNQKPDYWLPSK